MNESSKKQWRHPSACLRMSVYDLCRTRRDSVLTLSLVQAAALPQLMTNMGLG
jgi:hypothetical protein